METQNYQPQSYRYQSGQNNSMPPVYDVMPQNNSVVSVSDWVITMIIMIIPLANIIMLFVWAFSGSTPASKANWAKAVLIFWAISIVLAIVLYVVFAAAFYNAMKSAY